MTIGNDYILIGDNFFDLNKHKAKFVSKFTKEASAERKASKELGIIFSGAHGSEDCFTVTRTYTQELIDVPDFVIRDKQVGVVSVHHAYDKAHFIRQVLIDPIVADLLPGMMKSRLELFRSVKNNLSIVNGQKIINYLSDVTISVNQAAILRELHDGLSIDSILDPLLFELRGLPSPFDSIPEKTKKHIAHIESVYEFSVWLTNGGYNNNAQISANVNKPTKKLFKVPDGIKYHDVFNEAGWKVMSKKLKDKELAGIPLADGESWNLKRTLTKSLIETLNSGNYLKEEFEINTIGTENTIRCFIAAINNTFTKSKPLNFNSARRSDNVTSSREVEIISQMFPAIK